MFNPDEPMQRVASAESQSLIAALGFAVAGVRDLIAAHTDPHDLAASLIMLPEDTNDPDAD